MNDTKIGYPKMKPEIKTKWLVALRSGEYKQCKGYLKKKKKEKISYCCIGVLCEVINKPLYPSECDPNTFGIKIKRNFLISGDPVYRIKTDYPDDKTMKKVKIDAHTLQTLVDMNDDLGKSFKTIANWIEKNL